MEESQEDLFKLGEKLTNSGRQLHTLFKFLYPSQSKHKTGKRIEALIKIREKGEIHKYKERKWLKDIFGVETRQSVHGILKETKQLGLIVEKDNKLYLTQNGERLLDSLELFFSNLKGESKIWSKQEYNDIYYSTAEVYLFTNGYEPAYYIWFWEITNNSMTTIKQNEYIIQSAGTKLDKLDLYYSNNISNYKVTTDKGDMKIFNIYFRNPISSGLSSKYWYSYQWPGNFDPNWKPWDFTFRCRDFPVQNLNLIIINPKCFQILQDSISHNEELPEGSKTLGTFNIKGLDLVNTSFFSVLFYKANNIPKDSTIRLKWDFNYQQ